METTLIQLDWMEKNIVWTSPEPPDPHDFLLVGLTGGTALDVIYATGVKINHLRDEVLCLDHVKTFIICGNNCHKQDNVGVSRGDKVTCSQPDLHKNINFTIRQ